MMTRKRRKSKLNLFEFSFNLFFHTFFPLGRLSNNLNCPYDKRTFLENQERRFSKILSVNCSSLSKKILKRIENSRRIVKKEGNDVLVREELRGRRFHDISSSYWIDRHAVIIQRNVRGYLSRLRVLHRREKGTRQRFHSC